MTEEKLTGTEFLLQQLDEAQITIIKSAINVYGDAQHPMATTDDVLKGFKLGYIAHCLGRQHYAMIGAGLMKHPDFQNPKHVHLHEMHDSIIDAIEDAIEFGV